MQKLHNSPNGSLVSVSRGVNAYVPDKLPRDLELSPKLVYALVEASTAVGRLAGVGETVPNPYLLIRPFMQREAVLSSRIEGTQASLSDLVTFEASGRRNSDVQEVANYINALEHGIKRLPRNMAVETDHPIAGKVKAIGVPVKLSDTPGSIRTAAPVLGQHTEEVLAEAGYSKDEIASFKEEGAIG